MTLDEKRAVLMRAAEAGYFTEGLRAIDREDGSTSYAAVAPLAAALLGEPVTPSDLVAGAGIGRQLGSAEFWSAVFTAYDR